MEQEKETIGIEAGDFITPKKAITITTISMVIWVTTGWSYALLKLFFEKLPYENYTFVVSLLLSILFSIYVVRKLVRKTDLVMKIVIGALNTILIYTSANGEQATYGFLSPKPSAPPTTMAPQKPVPPVPVKAGFMIPFLDPRPWIPDKFLKAEYETLVNENKKLLLEKEELSRQNDLLQSTIISLKESISDKPDVIRHENLILHDSISVLVNNLGECHNQNEMLSIQLMKCKKGGNNTKTSSLQDSLIYLERINATCQKNNNQLARQLESLQGRIRQFNARQDLWKQGIAKYAPGSRNPKSSRFQEIAETIKRNVNSLMNDNTYYDFLFLTPINNK